MKRKDSCLPLLYCLMVLLLLPLSLHAVTVRFVTGMWSIDNQGNVAPAYIPFGESHEESLPTCVLEASGLSDDERIIHDYTDDTFAWICGPIGGAGSKATILMGETAAPNTITQPGSYTLTFTGYTQYYIQKNVNGAPVLEGPFTAVLEPANEHYSLSRPVKVVEVVSIQGHGKISSRKTAPLQRGEGASNGNGSQRESDSDIRTPNSMNRDGEMPNEPEYAPWTDGETIYAQPGAKINLNMYLNPGIAIDDGNRAKIQWGGFGNVSVNASDLRNVILTPTGFGNGLAVAYFGSNHRVMQIRCVPMAVHEVQFPNRIEIKKDTTGAIYGDTAWLDNDMDGTSDLIDANADSSKPYHPVAYCSTDYLKAKAKFRPNEKKCDGTTLLQESEYDAVADVKRVRYSIYYAPFVVSNAVNYNANGTEVGNENEYHFAGSPYVAYFPAWTIIWYIGFGENGTSDENLVWQDSDSTHELYLTYNGHESSYETVFHVGCTGADGLTSESDIVSSIFTNKFASTHLKRKGSNVELKYYGSISSDDEVYANTTPEEQGSEKLLKYQDGRCGDWAYFLHEINEIQGIGLAIVGINTNNSDKMLVKNWIFPLAYVFIGNYYPYWRYSLLNTTGIKGQGEMDTPGRKEFPDHAFVLYSYQMNVFLYKTVIYDPSYGTSYTYLVNGDDFFSFESQFYQDFENTSLAGYIKMIDNMERAGKTSQDDVTINYIGN